MTYISDKPSWEMQKEIDSLREQYTAVEEASNNLLDAMNEADHARGYDESQDARWLVTKMRATLSTLLGRQ